MAARARGLLVRTERIGVRAAWAHQLEMAAARRAGHIPDVVWLLEHPPTYTTGRHGSRADLWLADDALAGLGAEFVQLDRGGQMTWHGPGQTVAYVIADLRARGGRVREFVTALQRAMVVAGGVGATVGADAIGVYAGAGKLGSVGIRVADGVTTHGLALNRDPNPEWFTTMVACGAPGMAATSIAAEGGDADRERVEAALAAALADQLGLDLREVDPADLVDAAPDQSPMSRVRMSR